MVEVFRARFLFMVGICLFALVGPSLAKEDLRAQRHQQAVAIVQEYFRLEQARDYERVYGLYSSKIRRDLRGVNVKSGAEYKRLREIQGSKWDKFDITDVNFDTQLNAIVSVTAEYAQQIIGEHVAYGKVDLIVLVVWESEKPLIDSVN